MNGLAAIQESFVWIRASWVPMINIRYDATTRDRRTAGQADGDRADDTVGEVGRTATTITRANSQRPRPTKPPWAQFGLISSPFGVVHR